MQSHSLTCRRPSGPRPALHSALPCCYCHLQRRARGSRVSSEVPGGKELGLLKRQIHLKTRRGLTPLESPREGLCDAPKLVGVYPGRAVGLVKEISRNNPCAFDLESFQS